MVLPIEFYFNLLTLTILLLWWAPEQSIILKPLIWGVDSKASLKPMVWLSDRVHMSKVTSFILKIKLITIFGSKVESDQSASVRSSFRMCECFIMAVMSSSEKLLTAIVLMFWSLLDARIMGILARFPRFTQIWTQVQSFGASPISLHLRHTRTTDFKSIGSSSLKICSNTSAGNLLERWNFHYFVSASHTDSIVTSNPVSHYF